MVEAARIPRRRDHGFLARHLRRQGPTRGEGKSSVAQQARRRGTTSVSCGFPSAVVVSYRSPWGGMDSGPGPSPPSPSVSVVEGGGLPKRAWPSTAHWRLFGQGSEARTGGHLPSSKPPATLNGEPHPCNPTRPQPKAFFLRVDLLLGTPEGGSAGDEAHARAPKCLPPRAGTPPVLDATVTGVPIITSYGGKGTSSGLHIIKRPRGFPVAPARGPRFSVPTVFFGRV